MNHNIFEKKVLNKYFIVQKKITVYGLGHTKKILIHDELFGINIYMNYEMILQILKYY